MNEYTLTRSARKTIAIYIRDGVVDVRAPLKMPRSEIDVFVRLKSQWIESKLATSSQRLAQRQAFVLGYGDTILYRGQEEPIYAKQGKSVGFDNAGFYMPPNMTNEQIKATCVKLYRNLANSQLTMRVVHFALQMGLSPTCVKINRATTRWGSCSSRGNLNFSWRLIMAGDDVIDYVVVHELAHLLEMNHSPRFWAIVEGILPDYRQRQARLKQLQQRLAGENWE